jgi:hypothetical protein
MIDDYFGVTLMRPNVSQMYLTWAQLPLASRCCICKVFQHTGSSKGRLIPPRGPSGDEPSGGAELYPSQQWTPSTYEALPENREFHLKDTSLRQCPGRK